MDGFVGDSITNTVKATFIVDDYSTTRVISSTTVVINTITMVIKDFFNLN